MIFNVTRAVRGADSPPTHPADRLQRAIQTPLDGPSTMDLPRAEELLHLNMREFADTVPGDNIR